MTLNEGSLHKWFSKSKSKDGKKGWVNVVTGGTCASDKPGEGTPKCVSSSKRASMTKAERLSAQRRKKAADPNQQSKSGAAKPTYVRTDSKKKMKESKDVTAIAKELDKASKMHKGQAEKLRKHADSMKKPSKIDEKCWVGYTQKGMKKKGKKVVPNCVPVNEVAPPTDKHERMVKHIKKNYKKDGKLTKDEKSIAYATAWKNYNKEDKEYEDLKQKIGSKKKHNKPAIVDEACWKGYEKKGMKTMFGKRYPNCVKKKKTRKEEFSVEQKGYQPEIEHSKLGDAKKKKDKERESKLPPHLQGDALGKMKKAFASTNEEVVTEADKKGKGSGTKDACYHKVKSRYSVWPSAYASGALVKCRKVGAANWGNSSKKEEVEYTTEAKSPAWQRKEGKRESGGLNQKGVDSYRRANPGSKLKTAVTTKPSKLKKGSKSANRRKSFCARMSGMKKKLTSAKTANDPDSRINKSLRKWNCSYEPDGTPIMEGINFSAFRKKAATVEKKPKKAMDAGAKARRSMQRREYAKTVSGSTDRVPKDLED